MHFEVPAACFNAAKPFIATHVQYSVPTSVVRSAITDHSAASAVCNILVWRCKVPQKRQLRRHTTEVICALPIVVYQSHRHDKNITFHSPCQELLRCKSNFRQFSLKLTSKFVEFSQLPGVAPFHPFLLSCHRFLVYLTAGTLSFGFHAKVACRFSALLQKLLPDSEYLFYFVHGF